MIAALLVLLVVANSALADNNQLCHVIKGPTYERPGGGQVQYHFEYQCAGAVINNKYILTAADCLVDTDPGGVTTFLGALYNRLYGRPPPSSSCYYKTESTISHRRYDNLTHHNDIGLVRVKGEIEFNEFVRPICLPTSCSLMHMNFKRVPLRVMGWGEVKEGVPLGEAAFALKTAYLRTTDLDYCNRRWKDENGKSITSTQICTRGPHGEDACKGNSGGPLVYTVPTGTPRNVVVGVVSFGPPCDPANPSKLPGVFTRVSSFMTWILDNIHE